MSEHSSTLLLFGATGDLSRRMLLPSLYALHADELIDPALRIFGTARSAYSDAEFREFARTALVRISAGRPQGGRHDRCLFAASPLSGAGCVAARRLCRVWPTKIGDISGGLSIFLSTAPSLFEPTIKGLHSAGLAGDNVRIGLEKPLGTDLASSCQINDAVNAVFPEERTFRIDHYLGKETVQNLLALRFANMLFEPLWNANAHRSCADHRRRNGRAGRACRLL